MSKQPRVMSILVDDLNIDEAYQRTIDWAFVNRIANDFDPAGLGLVSVARRADGSYWVIDGQHRVEALRILAIPRVACLVEDISSLSDEAQVFILRNTQKKVLAFDKFKARLTAQAPDAVAIDTVCRSYGFPLVKSGGTAFSCVATVERIWRGIRSTTADRGPETLKATLSLMRSAWGSATPRPSGDITLALATFLDRYGDEIDTTRLALKLSGLPGGWTGLLGKARSLRGSIGGSVPQNAVEVVRSLYNGGLRKAPLPPFRKEALAA